MTASPPQPDPALGASGHASGHDHAEHRADTNCDEAVAELYAFLDGELDDVVMAQVEAHLRRCSPCLEAFDFEADLRRVISAKCTEQVTPQARARLCVTLRELSVRGTVTGGTDGTGGATGPSDRAGVPSPADGS